MQRANGRRRRRVKPGVGQGAWDAAQLAHDISRTIGLPACNACPSTTRAQLAKGHTTTQALCFFRGLSRSTLARPEFPSPNSPLTRSSWRGLKTASAYSVSAVVYTACRICQCAPPSIFCHRCACVVNVKSLKWCWIGCGVDTRLFRSSRCRIAFVFSLVAVSSFCSSSSSPPPPFLWLSVCM